MKALLIQATFITRVIVEDNATEEEILEVAGPRLMTTCKECLNECIDYIGDDVECPYDPEHDVKTKN